MLRLTDYAPAVGKCMKEKTGKLNEGVVST